MQNILISYAASANIVRSKSREREQKQAAIGHRAAVSRRDILRSRAFSLGESLERREPSREEADFLHLAQAGDSRSGREAFAESAETAACSVRTAGPQESIGPRLPDS